MKKYRVIIAYSETERDVRYEGIDLLSAIGNYKHFSELFKGKATVELQELKWVNIDIDNELH